VIVNWNTRSLLSECLKSIWRFPPSCGFEIIVVDNASADGSSDMVRDAFPNCILIASKTNLGYAKANNLGIEKAQGEFILTLNPDTELIDDSLDRCIAFMDDNIRAGAVAARLLNPDGSVQKSVRNFPTLSNILFEIIGLARLFPKSRLFGNYRCEWLDYAKTQQVEQPMGTFLLFRKAALDQIGRFDEAFPIFFNEVDLLRRMKDSGFEIWLCADTAIEHLGGASTRQVRKNMIWESHKSLMRYLNRWCLRWWIAPLLWALNGIIWLGAFVRARGVYAGFRP
jgi:GT2 family glycosyltransferase